MKLSARGILRFRVLSASDSPKFFQVARICLSHAISVRTVAAVFSVLLSLLIGFLAQASSPDYQRLCWRILPLAAANAGLIAFVWASKERRWRWLVLGTAALGFLSYFELIASVWLGFRLL